MPLLQTGKLLDEPSAISLELQKHLHVGIDEAGRGCLAGPVVAGAVIFPTAFDFSHSLAGLTDSKKLTEKKRNALAPLISQHALAYGIGIAWQDEIDAVNILNATFRAMCRAYLALTAQLHTSHPAVTPNLAIIDGIHTIPPTQWNICLQEVPSQAAQWETMFGIAPQPMPVPAPVLPPQYAEARADATYPSVSAASILAKTYRDALMTHADAIAPKYGFAVHKGYGTKQHLGALQAHGSCVLHRMTFKKVRPEEVQVRLLSP